MSGAEAVAAAADSALARLAERALTLVGVPLLLAVVGFVASELWQMQAEGVRRQAAQQLVEARLGGLEVRMKEEAAQFAGALAEAVRRGEQSRQAADRVRDDRDAAHDRQLAELAGGIANGREVMARLGAQLDGVRSALDEIKGLLQRPPPPSPVLPPPRDRLSDAWQQPRGARP